MLVREAMSDEVVTVDADASLREAVERMLREGVGSVVVTRDGTPAGILTETDALKAGHLAERPFAEIPMSKAATGSLATVSPGTTLRKAVRTMRERDVKKLPVVESMELVGILTTTDVVRNQEALLDEAHRVSEGREGWSPERRQWDAEGR